MDGENPDIPAAYCYTEPVNCDCPHGSYTGTAGLARLIDIIIQYYAPPRWARYIIGTVFFAWYVAITAQRWLELFVTVAVTVARRRGGGNGEPRASSGSGKMRQGM
ncbi:hypothetical protein CPLU01_11378 [Colletotrichum plurivorum]|uniref:Uncharacterized protein n=1 Tax=Colletotrichum plurivorum TaxID=2175906 RepID=A0A8H6N8F2_9PEZI|nr:hypothetical protein CPLU01_11378 [Colletotrichum plurivorum]